MRTLTALKEVAEKKIAQNKKWVATSKGRKAMKVITDVGINKAEMIEYEITRAIQKATEQETYLGLNRIARAIRNGVGGKDLPELLKAIQKYEL